MRNKQRLLRNTCLGVVLVVVIAALWVVISSPSYDDHYFDSDGVTIRYIDIGSGPPVVLVHGYTSNAERSWGANHTLQDLAEDHRVIALDCRGHGKSGKPHDDVAYGVQMGLDIVRLLDHLNIPQAHIAGYSMGGAITAHLLTIHPERFLTATLGGSGGRLNWSEEDEKRAQKEADEMAEGSIASMYARLTASARAEHSEWKLKLISAFVLAGQDQYALAAVRRSNGLQVFTGQQMAAVTVPTQAIIGSLDPKKFEVDRLAEVMPSLTVHVVEGAAHDGADEAFAHRVRAFIAAHTIP